MGFTWQPITRTSYVLKYVDVSDALIVEEEEVVREEGFEPTYSYETGS
jgi:hypothetical protein